MLKLTADFSVDNEVLHQLPLERLVTYERVDSTNSEAMRLLRQGQACPFLVLASQQTDGRGRRGRRWESPPGAGLYYTLALEVDRDTQNIAALSLVTALSVCSALEKLGVNKLELKWPNDLLINRQKFCGILQEVIKFDNFDYLIVGIGLNTNIVPKNKSFKSTCLKNILNKKVNNHKVLKNIIIAYGKFLKEKNQLSYSDLKKRYKE